MYFGAIFTLLLCNSYKVKPSGGCASGTLFLYDEIMNVTDERKKYMRRAIELAWGGMGYASPNPMVGAVIVKDGRIIGEGFHRRCGELHAERDAFAHLTEDANGAEMYVTLEPCCHYGKQPPCTLAVVEHGISRVYVGSRDPNPLVSGKGAAFLRENGIEVVEDFLREECDKLNPEFFHFISTGKPYVVMKYAMTADGKIATKTGDSKWITGEAARKNVHLERSRYAAILAGIGTVLADDPMLNARIDSEEKPGGFLEGYDVTLPDPVHQPIRVVVDAHLRIPPESNLIRTAHEYRTILACAEAAEDKKQKLMEAGAEVISLPGEDGEVSLTKLMDYLGENKIASVYIEGGGTIHEAAVRAGIVQKVSAYIGPKIFGGSDAKTPVEGGGFAKVSDSMQLHLTALHQLGEDVWLEYERK